MLLIAAALKEELKSGMELCRDLQKSRGVDLWQGIRGKESIGFLKTGVGPKRAAASLGEALKAIEPARILVIGYAGAIDPDLRLGELVAVSNALAFSLDKDNPDWEQIQLDDAFELDDCEALADCAKLAGIGVRIGDTLTSSYVLGDPVHKRRLHERFHASIVDMETAALAGIASPKAIPVSCIRAVSDEASDTFLAPFSYDPATNISARTKKLFSTGMAQTYREWKDHAAIARESLRRFLSCYL
jgi:adenosylhomocysteine nucleosidase